MNTSEKTQHSKIGASSMSRWAACPGSVKLSEGIPPTTTSFAEEGTKAHEVAEKLLRNEKVGAKKLPKDMLDACMVYVRYVHSIQSDANRNGKSFIEHRFDLGSLHPGLFGTADFVLYDSKTKVLEVVDYKHGAGIAVEVVDNKQLKYYGLGALISLGFPCREIKLTIVQPRCDHKDGPIRSWSLSTYEMQEFAAELIEAAQKTEDKNAPLVSGAHCRFCPAAPLCPQLRNEAQAMAKKVFNETLSYNPQELSHVLGRLPLIESWVKSVREFAYNQALQGNEVPGFKLVEKRALRKWNDVEEAEAALKAMRLKKAEMYVPAQIKSVAQVERALNKAQKSELTKYYSKISSGMTLVPDTDGREAVKRVPSDVFDNIEGEV